MELDPVRWNGVFGQLIRDIHKKAVRIWVGPRPLGVLRSVARDPRPRPSQDGNQANPHGGEAYEHDSNDLLALPATCPIRTGVSRMSFHLRILPGLARPIHIARCNVAGGVGWVLPHGHVRRVPRPGGAGKGAKQSHLNRGVNPGFPSLRCGHPGLSKTALPGLTARGGVENRGKACGGNCLSRRRSLFLRQKAQANSKTQRKD